MTDSRVIPLETKRAIAAAYMRGEPVAFIESRFGVGHGTPWRIAKQFGATCRRTAACRLSMSIWYARKRHSEAQISQ